MLAKILSASKKAPISKKVPAAKKAPTSKKAPPKSTASASKRTASKALTANDTKANTSRKRKISESEDEDDAPKPPPRATKKARAPKAPQPPKQKVVINQAPTKLLNVYVFGEGSAGELGLGSAKTAIDVKRPRLNPHLSAQEVGIVSITCGGMHAVALTHNNQILTWGVNDDGALGRDTSWSGGLRDVNKEDSDSEDEDSGLNPKESTPTAIPSSSFPEGTIFTSIAASDSASFAVTDEGLVYGWGTFRVGQTRIVSTTGILILLQNSEGILGFSHEAKVQKNPILLEHLSKIKSVVCGSNSAFALDINGHAYCWGANAQSQLGYRAIERHQPDTIIPTPLRMGRKKICYIACGNDHAFAIDNKDQVWAWGLNGHGQTGTHIQKEGSSANIVHVPTKVPDLTRPNDKVIEIAGGGFHTVAVTENGTCLTFGRCDNNQMGIDPATLTEDQVRYNDSGKRAAQTVPLPIPNVTGAKFAAAGTDHSIVISGDDEAYSWGFSTNYQTGQGKTDDVLVPTKLENTAVRGKKITWAGCGGQFSIIAGPAEI